MGAESDYAIIQGDCDLGVIKESAMYFIKLWGQRLKLVCLHPENIVCEPTPFFKVKEAWKLFPVVQWINWHKKVTFAFQYNTTNLVANFWYMNISSQIDLTETASEMGEWYFVV